MTISKIQPVDLDVHMRAVSRMFYMAEISNSDLPKPRYRVTFSWFTTAHEKAENAPITAEGYSPVKSGLTNGRDRQVRFVDDISDFRVPENVRELVKLHGAPTFINYALEEE
jgi:hypothetical protein